MRTSKDKFDNPYFAYLEKTLILRLRNVKNMSSISDYSNKNKINLSS